MERKTMIGEQVSGAAVPVAPEAGEAEVGVVGDEGAAAGAEGAGDEEISSDGEGEAVPGSDDAEIAEHKLPAEAQEAVNKRIGALTAKRKAAEQERDALKAERDELAQRAERLGDAATVRAAEAAGVLPELLGKGEAEKIRTHAEAKRSAEYFSEWLEDNADPEATLEMEGKSYTRQQVREFRRHYQRKLEELDDVPALTQKLRKDSADILRLGMAARKAGWKPGQAAAPAAGAAAAGTAAKPKLPVAPVPARTMPGSGAKPRPAAEPGARKAYETGRIKDEDDLALAIERGDL
jgi:hypothetical protein